MFSVLYSPFAQTHSAACSTTAAAGLPRPVQALRSSRRPAQRLRGQVYTAPPPPLAGAGDQATRCPDADAAINAQCQYVTLLPERWINKEWMRNRRAQSSSDRWCASLDLARHPTPIRSTSRASSCFLGNSWDQLNPSRVQMTQMTLPSDLLTKYGPLDVVTACSGIGTEFGR